jgi:hypothetical protein
MELMSEDDKQEVLGGGHLFAEQAQTNRRT